MIEYVGGRTNAVQVKPFSESTIGDALFLPEMGPRQSRSFGDGSQRYCESFGRARFRRRIMTRSLRLQTKDFDVIQAKSGAHATFPENLQIPGENMHRTA